MAFIRKKQHKYGTYHYLVESVKLYSGDVQQKLIKYIPEEHLKNLEPDGLSKRELAKFRKAFARMAGLFPNDSIEELKEASLNFIKNREIPP